ncbi:phage/plasmid primase, P4 family [Vibrio rotiferianus]|uniref:phage/plasmid primase, P4 family n=1 Tax=Vibrio rotiferianus TaxID=190895 RepID=UPI00406A83AA
MEYFEDSKVKFISMIVERGLEPPKRVVADGKLHRFSSNGKPGDKAGYYVLYTNADGSVVGKFGCWRSVETTSWSSKGHSNLSLTDKLELQERNRNAQLEIEKVIFKRTQFAKSVINNAKPASSNHAYIQKKGGLPVDGVFEITSIPCSLFFDNPKNQKVMRNLLLVPVSDKDGQLLTLQAISERGEKMFMSGGSTKGGMFTFNGSNEQIFVAEGFATAASIHAATGNTVVCAFNANNLKLVAPQVKQLNPEVLVIVAADNDHENELNGKGNKGREIAQELFEKEGLPYCFPEFEEGSSGTDWNDYALEYGIDMLSKAIQEALVMPKAPITTFEQAIGNLTSDADDVEAYNVAIEFIKNAQPLFKSRMMKQLKDITNVPFKDIHASIAELKSKDQPEQLSHGEIAHAMIDGFTKVQMVAAYGYVWTYEAISGLWSSMKLSHLGNKIACKFNNQDKCKRVSDYKAIAGFVYDLQEEQEFFDNAPDGIATPSGFLCVSTSAVEKRPFSPLQRSRHSLHFEPAPAGTKPELFLGVLNSAFEGCYPKEQIRQLRMLFGLSVFGLMPKHQTAVLLHGAGGSGKSLVLKVLESLLSSEAIATVSPMQMDKDYKVATLAGKRFNLVPELDKDTPIPSAAFKAIVGGDTINAREPYGKSFNFTPNVTNWFNGNFFPKTTDHTLGFYRRWTIVHFHNTKPENERDPFLLEKIVANELPAILTWAIEGVEDYLQQSFDLTTGDNTNHSLYFSPAHHQYLAKWLAETDSVKGWLSDTGENGILKRERGSSVPPLRLSLAYSIYKEWCVAASIKPYSKTEFELNMEMCGYVASKPQNTKTYMELSQAPTAIETRLKGVA